MSKPPIFSVHHKFGPASGDGWRGYVEWTGLVQVQELTTIDPLLCRPVFDGRLTDEDWNYNVQQSMRTYYFHDHAYLARRVGFDPRRHNLLALFEEPTDVPAPLDGFEFCGFDILDSDDSISVLLNCGGFPDIYQAHEHDARGLLDDLTRAEEIAARIRAARPDEHHCRSCRVWGVGRFVA